MRMYHLSIVLDTADKNDLITLKNLSSYDPLIRKEERELLRKLVKSLTPVVLEIREEK